MHKAWARFSDAFAAAAADKRPGPGASPLDPAGWLRPEGQGGMADLWRWIEGPDLADIFREERAAIRATREWIAFAAALEQFRAVVAITIVERRSSAIPLRIFPRMFAVAGAIIRR